MGASSINMDGRRALGDVFITYNRSAGARGMKPADEKEDIGIESILRAHLTGRSVLLLEDELIFAMPIADALQRFGVERVQHVKLGEVAAREGSERNYDVLLFDRDNPGMDGLEALRLIRASGQGSFQAPALIITGKINSAKDRSFGLLSGADDYIDKAVGPIEIMARIVNCLSRAKAQTPFVESNKSDPRELRNGPLTINAREMRAYFFGEFLNLGTQSYDILRAFCEAPGQPFTKSMVFEIASPHWKNKPLPPGFEGVLHKAVNRLRATLEPYEQRLPRAMQPILVTLRSQGYMLRDLSAVQLD